MRKLILTSLAIAMLVTAMPYDLSASEPPRAPRLIGVNLYLRGLDGDDGTLLRSRVTTLLDTRAQAGDTAITLSIPVFQASWDANVVAAKAPDTPNQRDIAWVIDEAAARNLTVFVRPLLDEQAIGEHGPRGAWRGSIEPQDEAAWFDSYGSLLNTYLQLAARADRSWLVIGTELSSLESSRHWAPLIERLRTTATAHPVRLTYSMNWDRTGDWRSWYDDLDGLAVDAFFPLDVDADAGVGELASAMESWRDDMADLRNQLGDRPLFVSEIGIASVRDTYRKPWHWGGNGNDEIDLEAQRRFFAAACQVYVPDVDGTFWWAAFLHDIPTPHKDASFSFIGKPAEREVNACSALHGRNATS